LLPLEPDATFDSMHSSDELAPLVIYCGNFFPAVARLHRFLKEGRGKHGEPGVDLARLGVLGDELDAGIFC